MPILRPDFRKNFPENGSEITKGKQMKNKKILTVALFVSVISVAIAGNENYKTGKVLNDKVYYAIGGGSVVPPPVFRGRSNEIGVGIGWNSDFSCGNFDLFENVKASVSGEQIKNSMRGLMNNFFSSVKGAIASMPAQMLQRANPQLYDQLQNSMFQAKLDFDNMTTSCEEMSDFIADSDAVQNLIKKAQSMKMKDLINTGKKNIADAVDNAKKAADEGIEWIRGGKAGGKSGKAIEIVKDAVEVGFNKIQNRNADDMSDVKNCNGTICEAFKNPKEASEFAKDVIGETTIVLSDKNKEKAAPSSSSGNGLPAQVTKEIEKTLPVMEDALNAEYITDEQLEKLNSSTFKITRNALQDIKESSDAELLAKKVTSELAYAKSLEKALLIRRTLINSLHNPASAAGKEQLTAKLNLLDAEIQQLKMELELNNLVGNRTMLVGMEEAAQHRNRNAISNSSIDLNELNLDKEPTKAEGVHIINADTKKINLTNGSGSSLSGNGNLSNLNGNGGTKGGLPMVNRTGKTTYVPQPDGSYIARKGDRNFANANPGNIECGAFAKSQGAVGCDGRFAVFPDHDTGRKALENLIGGNAYKDLNLSAAINKYAPNNENNTEGYIKHLVDAGVDPNKPLGQMTKEERAKMAEAITSMEGQYKGTETIIPAKK